MTIEVNKKMVEVPDKEIENLMQSLEITEQEAINTWLFDNDLIDNEQVDIMTQKAKVNKTGAKADKKEHKQTTRERKENPVKEQVITATAEMLQALGFESVVVENKGKIIRFKQGERAFKFDLTETRKPKN